jgi:hypothetical protein
MSSTDTSKPGPIIPSVSVSGAVSPVPSMVRVYVPFTGTKKSGSMLLFQSPLEINWSKWAPGIWLISVPLTIPSWWPV